MVHDRHRGYARQVTALILGTVLAGCSVDMTHPLKTADEVALDKSRCMELAEEDSLMRAHRARNDQVINTARTPKPGNYGESPMQMVDRFAVRKDYNSGYVGCLEARGYTQTKK